MGDNRISMPHPIGPGQPEQEVAVTLRDLQYFYTRYVPWVSRHPNGTKRKSWWPAHELGHLLTVPRKSIGIEMFGMAPGITRWHPKASLWYAYELAAMDVSRRLLRAAGRPELFRDELETSDDDVLEFGSWRRAQRIINKAGVRRLPSGRDGLEQLIIRKIS